MADVSVRFQVAGDAEVVLNLALPQAIRLMEAIARKVGEAMASAGPPGQPSGVGPYQQVGMQPSGGPASRPMGAPGWGDTSVGPDRRRQG